MLFYTIMILILGILSAGITVFFFFRWRQNRNVPEDINTENTTVPAHISILPDLGQHCFFLFSQLDLCQSAFISYILPVRKI